MAATGLWKGWPIVARRRSRACHARPWPHVWPWVGARPLTARLGRPRIAGMARGGCPCRRWPLLRATTPRFDVLVVSAIACMAVGSTNGLRAPTLMLAERWNGYRWSIETPVAPPGAVQHQLAGVSCLSRFDCIAVGSASFGGADCLYNADCTIRPLVERWNGAQWSMTRSRPRGASGATLTDVSCVPEPACFAVGTMVRRGRRFGLTERWNGSTWPCGRSSRGRRTSSQEPKAFRAHRLASASGSPPSEHQGRKDKYAAEALEWNPVDAGAAAPAGRRRTRARRGVVSGRVGVHRRRQPDD